MDTHISPAVLNINKAWSLKSNKNYPTFSTVWDVVSLTAVACTYVWIWERNEHKTYERATHKTTDHRFWPGTHKYPGFGRSEASFKLSKKSNLANYLHFYGNQTMNSLLNSKIIKSRDVFALKKWCL